MKELLENKPLCSYFGRCGGCTMQHIEYQQQLTQKKEAVQKSLRCESVVVHSDTPYNYRNRMDFLFHPAGLGLRARKNACHIIDISKCVISEEPINQILKELRQHCTNVDAYDEKKRTGTFISAHIRTALNKTAVLFVLYEHSQRLKDAVEHIETFAKKTTAENIAIAYASSECENFAEESVIIKGQPFLEVQYCGKDFTYPLITFFQNNHAIAEKMHAHVSKIMQEYNPEEKALIDLYAGVGCFGVINAALFKKAVSIENNPLSVLYAKKNIERNATKNAETLCGDAKSLKKITPKEQAIVITDPPRTGMDQQAISALRDLKPEAIIYISCNYHQLAKDLKKLKEYAIQSVAVFDMFPQTHHCETVVELKRNK